MRIQQLPMAVANQIAAGEVIERPASIVKELLENSFDAKASSIHIEISYGGLNQVKISDDGLGIVADDLPLAIAPHATSKICELGDLFSIASMGFRGEALASIASISRLSISSKPVCQMDAMKLVSTEEGIRIHPCARKQGTTIDVRDLFYNAPVRKKFLKSEQLEFQIIEAVVKRFALAAPEISIQLHHNDKKIFQLPAANDEKSRLARIQKIFGKAFMEKAHYIEAEHLGMRLWGWISSSDYQRSQNDKQWIYVNKRMVKDKLLNHAIKQAYEDSLHPGRHPACLLYLEIRPEEVDVNVHPTKHEVRFQQPRMVHDFISSQIQGTLISHKQCFYDSAKEPPKKALELRESTWPLPGLASKTSNHSADWYFLKPDFAIIRISHEPYLVELSSLYRHWLNSTLLAHELPLAHRPLLVPITLKIEAFKEEDVLQAQHLLKRYGIEITWVAEQTLLIRTIPIIMPYIDIKQCLIAIVKERLFSNSAFMEAIIKYQAFVPDQISAEDKVMLITHMQCLESLHSQPWCRHLSLKTCQDLLHD
ncbi:DNA mismatch repair endonuclease MutL [Legionella jordanis]|uniref:DNA mismatch repair protein MutL n=1 Tax=Legionella jordanis TaxID=456 RepID=A0A0W0VBR0_9GAMM|nr:DNA mismatch repair endonuclease MutL [Legionella jordanis]KTD17528.1 DNA mismatch repair protein MutL [Legionella jordanis]VEH13497.1 DNA mismatch repair protein MutL [Legionella jordanis]